MQRASRALFSGSGLPPAITVFRKAYLAQGRSLDDLPYHAKWYPFGPIFALIVGVIVILAQDYQAFLGGRIDWMSAIAAYLGIPLFAIMWLGYKLVKRTKVIPLEACRIDDRGFDQEPEHTEKKDARS